MQQLLLVSSLWRNATNTLCYGLSSYGPLGNRHADDRRTDQGKMNNLLNSNEKINYPFKIQWQRNHRRCPQIMGPQIIQGIISLETVSDDFQLNSEPGKHLALGQRSPCTPQALWGEQIFFLTGRSWAITYPFIPLICADRCRSSQCDKRIFFRTRWMVAYQEASRHCRSRKEIKFWRLSERLPSCFPKEDRSVIMHSAEWGGFY